MDIELKRLLSKVTFPQIDHVTPEVVKMMRTATATPPSYLEDLKAKGVSHRKIKIHTTDGSNHEIILSVLQKASELNKPRPCIYWMHGGECFNDQAQTKADQAEVVSTGATVYIPPSMQSTSFSNAMWLL